MSVKTLPTDLCTSSFRWKLKRNQVVSGSPFGMQGLETSAPLWTCSMVGVPEYMRDAIILETFLESLDGHRNQVAVYNRAQPEPAGTMRGTMVLAADAADGALALSISAGGGQAGRTLLTGDLIGIGSGLTQQVLRIGADATANGSGVIAVTLNHPLQGAFTAGASVRWDRPEALFRQVLDNSGIEYTPGIGQPWSLDLIESRAP
jgi:hypothetical protein